jgi:hypothetical protein
MLVAKKDEVLSLKQNICKQQEIILSLKLHLFGMICHRVDPVSRDFCSAHNFHPVQLFFHLFLLLVGISSNGTGILLSAQLS